MAAEPIKVGNMVDKKGNIVKGQAARIFSVDGKSMTLLDYWILIMKGFLRCQQFKK